MKTPHPPMGRYFDQLLALNRPRWPDFCHWGFHAGMLFQANQQWWGRQQLRPQPHEGLDICWFLDVAGSRRSLEADTVIPAPFRGRVVSTCQDFLGQSIFLLHAGLLPPDYRLLTALGHVSPFPGVVRGTELEEGEAMATLSSAGGRRNRVPPHLHLTVAIVPADFPVAEISWPTLSNSGAITLIDPLMVFPTSFALVDSEVDYRP